MLTLCPSQLAPAQCDFKFWALEREALQPACWPVQAPQRLGSSPCIISALVLANPSVMFLPLENGMSRLLKPSWGERMVT